MNKPAKPAKTTKPSNLAVAKHDVDQLSKTLKWLLDENCIKLMTAGDTTAVGRPVGDVYWQAAPDFVAEVLKDAASSVGGSIAT